MQVLLSWFWNIFIHQSGCRFIQSRGTEDGAFGQNFVYVAYYVSTHFEKWYTHLRGRILDIKYKW